MHTSDKYIRFRLCNDKRPTKERIKKYTLVVGALSTYVFHKAGEKKSENLFLSLIHSLSCLSVKHLTKHINVFLHVNLTGDLVNYVSSSSFLSTRLPAPTSLFHSQSVFASFDSSVIFPVPFFVLLSTVFNSPQHDKPVPSCIRISISLNWEIFLFFPLPNVTCKLFHKIFFFVIILISNRERLS